MHDTSPRYLMMIEPKHPCTSPVEDELTEMAVKLLTRAVPSEYRYRGFHTCVCGSRSDNFDHIIHTPAGQITTNSLLAHYIRNHREEVPHGEIEKLRRIYTSFFQETYRA